MTLQHDTADLGDDVRLHYVSSGQGLPVVLLHGWPQSWFCWRHVIPLLAAKYHVIAPDLRGLGDSSRPASGYDKRTIGNDIWRLMYDRLGHKEFYLVGHDWGGVVAYSIAASHPQAVKKLAILDITIPGDGQTQFSQGGRRWHHAFHQTTGLPEALVQDREEIYLTWFFQNFMARPDVLSREEIAEYVRCFKQPGALHAGFEFYRALPQDTANNAEFVRTLKLPMPVLALGGSNSWGRGSEVINSLRRVADNVSGGEIENCGHFIPDEQPQVLSEMLLKFFET